MNTYGTLFRVTTFGESHGAAIGGVIDGMPPGIQIDMDFLQAELNRRRPGQSALTTSRKESDSVELLSGVFEGRSTGCPIGFIVRNEQPRSADYDNLRDLFRPSHADYTYQQKYGIRDHRGGGRSSARETVSRVVAGAFAKMALRQFGVTITAYTSQVGTIALPFPYSAYDFSEIEKNPVRCPDPKVAEEMANLIAEVKSEGDTIGGVATCVIQGAPAGLGEPAFGKFQSMLASAMLSINAAKGFEYGSGFAGVALRGSQHNDVFARKSDGAIGTQTNHSGGIQGGITNGEDIYFRVAFKPVATLLREQDTVNSQGKPTVVKARGRHDPCVLPRAVPIVEAMTACVVLDNIMLNNTQKC
ncbi:MAG: chorismate synthase [Bacteroidaceae bacterium]|nr:chorismate synthase [Bacteroidaceae bacterium]